MKVIHKFWSINFFHLAWSSLGGNFWAFFYVWKLFLNLVIIDWETELDHSVDSAGEWGWLIKREAWSQKSSVEKKPDKILNCLVASVFLGFLLEFRDNWVFWVDFHGLLGNHVVWHGSISKSLSFHDSLHVGWPSVLACNKCARRFGESVTNLNFFDFVS